MTFISWMISGYSDHSFSQDLRLLQCTMSPKQKIDPRVMLEWNAANCASPIVNSGYLSSAIGGSGYTPIGPLMTLMRYYSIPPYFVYCISSPDLMTSPLIMLSRAGKKWLIRSCNDPRQ